jgi:hypothetical protein
VSNKPLILSDNLFENVVLHPTFLVQNFNTDDAAGHEAFRLADNLRDMTFWTRTTSNANSFVDVDCLAPVSPNTIILDRGHNLAGKTVVVNGYDDLAHTAGINISGNCVIPTTPGGLPTDQNGCLTPDGVWWKTFTPSAKRVPSFTVLAMGVGLAPIVTGVYLGTSYRFPEYLNAPAAYDFGTQVTYKRNELSRGGVRSKSRPLNFDRLQFSVDLDSGDYAGFDVQVRNLLRYGQPWWFCLDDSDAPGSGLMRMFQSAQDIAYDPRVNPVHREIRFDLEEVIPTLYV